MTEAKKKKQDDTRLNLASHDAVGERIEQLKALLPEIFVDGQLDPERLRQHLGDFSKVGAERYGLNWAGKAEAIRSLQIPSHGTLVPLKDQSVNFDESENMIIEGDNLEVLKLLQKSYHGKIKMIYIDPPYNTGGDFIYPDNFKEGLDTYLRYSGQATEQGFKVSTNSENGGRYHSNWLNMMYPRLFMAKNLLRDDGIIFISIDDHELCNLRQLMDEIFGTENFIAILPTIMNLKGNPDNFGFSDTHEYVVVYARIKEKCQVGVFDIDESDLDEWSEDEWGLYKRADTLRRTGQDASRAKRPKGWFPIFISDNQTIYTTEDDQPITKSDQVLWPVNEEAEELSWTWSKKKINDENHNLILVNGRNGLNIYKKQRPQIGELPTKKPKSVFYKSDYSTSTATNELKKLLGKKVFDGPKPVPLIKDLIQIGTEKDSIVLDFFAGSRTTAHAVLEANLEDQGNRRFICVQLPEPAAVDSDAFKAGYKTIAEITRDRASRVCTKLKGNLFSNSDWGFKALRLSSSNFKLWDASAGSKDADGLAKQLELYADNLLPGRSQDDILYEVILKAGQPLTAKIEKIEVAGQRVFSIGGGAMLICLEDPIKEETLVGMLEYQPAVMVALDKAFHGNDQLKTNIKLQAEATGESEQSRVLFKTV